MNNTVAINIGFNLASHMRSIVSNIRENNDELNIENYIPTDEEIKSYLDNVLLEIKKDNRYSDKFKIPNSYSNVKIINTETRKLENEFHDMDIKIESTVRFTEDETKEFISFYDRNIRLKYPNSRIMLFTLSSD